tara:strand:- start:104 stop:487 length:384 start_codon:yes stop_codon:yes gene_type:complete
MANVYEGMTLTTHNFQMKLFPSIAVAAAVISTSFIAASPAQADLRNVGGDIWTATDENGATHRIEYVRLDHEGDVQLRVLVSGKGETYYWVDCTKDLIAVAGDDSDGWYEVDHRTMNGYYTDVACRL